jgi:hypothetical protein
MSEPKPSNPLLAAMQQRFSRAESDLTAQEERKKQQQESNISSLSQDVSKLEKTLAAEIQRRVQSSKALQDLFADQIIQTKEKLNSLLNERLGALENAAETLGRRVTAVERDFATERERYVREISDRTAAVAADVVDLQTALARERAIRDERENSVARKIAETELKMERTLQMSKSQLEQKMNLLRDSLVEYKRIRDRGDDKFQTFVLEEIAVLKNSVVIETQSREAADDDIVQALNHYTKALQDALRIVNSN